MPAVPKQKKPCKSSVYMDEERRLMAQYKDDFMAVFHDKEARAKVIKSKKLSRWIANNWRGPRTKTQDTKAGDGQMWTTTSHVVWRTMRERVDKELKGMLGVEQVDTQHPAFFRSQPTAVKKVYESLNAQEREVVKQEAAKMRAQGNPPEVQRRNTAGKMVHQICENFGECKGLPGELFQRKYTADIKALQIKLVTFLNDLDAKIAGASGMAPALAPAPATQASGPIVMPALAPAPMVVTMTPSGFPIVPLAPGPTDVVDKESLEEMLRIFLRQHYRLASGHGTKHLTWGLLKSDPDKLVESKYYPANFRWTDAHNLKISSILDFFEHARSRQTEFGPEDAFCFKAYSLKTSTKERVFCPANYPETANADADSGAPNEGTKSQQPKSKKVAAPKQKQGKQNVKQNADAETSAEADPTDARAAADVGFGEANAPEQCTGSTAPSAVFPNAEVLVNVTAVFPNAELFLVVSQPMPPNMYLTPSPGPSEDENIDPALRTNADTGLILVDQQEMATLKALGYLESPPVNGPSDSPPRYAVPSSALAFPRRNATASGIGSEAASSTRIDPHVTPNTLSGTPNVGLNAVLGQLPIYDIGTGGVGISPISSITGTSPEGMPNIGLSAAEAQPLTPMSAKKLSAHPRWHPSLGTCQVAQVTHAHP
ncbi:unnamed protein product [Cyclocybe aegerita]|uniref:Uncharacterized protein n=1 Tax=Cyclocybe aegerita TaxID=1973307 RepID=A0A8S0VYX6_CYCAE|nr:unnamed protein product [Cyclocybe aegerita]